MRALLAFLLALALPAGAQDWVTPIQGQKAGMITSFDTRTAVVPGTRQVETARFIQSIVPAGSVSFQWALFVEQFNFSNAGENVAAYFRTKKHGKAAHWPLVLEANDYYPGNDGQNLYGLELDYMGARGRTTTGAAFLLAIGRASGSPNRDPGDIVPATIDTAVRITPYFPDWGRVSLNTGIRFDVACDVACLSLQGGSAIKFSDDPMVPVHRFDPPTGYVGYWRDRLCVWCVHAVTGQVASMRQF